MAEELSIIERMMKGEFDNVEIDESIPAQEAVNEDDNTSGSDDSTEELDTTNDEDTEISKSENEEEDTEEETNDLNDDEDQDTDDESDEENDDEDSVNTLVESDKKEEAETKDQIDGKDSDTEELNYKEEYAKLLDESKLYKDYYDKVTSEFTANGKKVKGFTDPEKVIQAQQALYGLEDKFSALKKYKQFHAPLEKRGMITDQKKFDLAMNIMDGDVEALKLHMKSLNIDPMEIDLDNVSYTGKRTTSSEIEMGLNDVIQASESAGVRNDVERVLYNEWDEDSVVDLLSTEGSRNMFLEHMRKDETGASIFDRVQSKVKEMSALSAGSGFSELKSIDKYNMAMKELSKEHQSNNQNQNTAPQSRGIPEDKIVEAETASAKKIAEAQAEAVRKYKEEVAKKNKDADEARKKASSVSGKKNVKSSKPKVDPMKLEGESFNDYWKQLTRAGLN